MSVASQEADLIHRKKENASELYAALDALWSAAANGELPTNGELQYAEDILERIDGRD